MAACPAVILAMSLLLLASIRSCRGDNLVLAGLQPLDALKDIGHALNCVSDVMQQSMQLHAENSQSLQASLDIQRQNSDSLAAVGRLADVVLQLKDQVGQQQKDASSMKEELAAFRKAEKLARENEDLKLRLATEETKVQNLEKQLMQTAQISEKQTDTEKLLNDTVAQLQQDLIVARTENYQNILQVQILNHSLSAVKAENEQNVIKVQELDKKLKESDAKVEQLEEKLTHLNQSVQISEHSLSAVKAENEQNVIKVQEFDKKLKESEAKVEQLEEKLTHLNQSVQISEHNLSAVKTENEQNVIKVQELDKKLKESEAKVGQLEEKLTHLNQSVQCPDKETEETCNLPGKDRIRQLMHEYDISKNWNSVKRGLEEVLDKSSTAYQQLKSIDFGESMTLYWVGRSGHKALVEVLVSCGPAVNIIDADGYTLLYGAAYSGDVEMAKLLLDHGANIELGYVGGWTPLMNAAWAGHLEFVKFLVNAGANTAAINDQGHTALSLAREYTRPSVVQYLSQLHH